MPAAIPMKVLNIISASVLLLASFTASPASSPALPKVAEKFEIDGHTAYLFAAPTPAAGKPWVWFAPALKGVSLAQRKVYFEAFLRHGVSLAGYDLGEVRGAPASTAEFARFHGKMVRRGFSPKPILIGQSRGGLMMLGWAMRHPDQVRAFVGIYPVCNLGTWGLKNLPVTLADYGMTERELRARLAEFNPLDNLQALAEKQVPMFIVQGDADKAVPSAENALLLQKRYAAAGGPITVRLIADEGHKVSPAFFENPELVDFVLQQAGVRRDATR